MSRKGESKSREFSFCSVPGMDGLFPAAHRLSVARVLWADHAASLAHAEHVEAFWNSHCPPQLSRDVLSAFPDNKRDCSDRRPTLQDGDAGLNEPNRENQLRKVSKNAPSWHIFVLPVGKVKKVSMSCCLLSDEGL